MSVLKTDMIIPNKGLISGEPELLEPGVLTDAENVILHPTLGIQTRPGIFTDGIFRLDSDIKNIRLVKSLSANKDDYLFILGANTNVAQPSILYIALIDINKKSIKIKLSINKNVNKNYYSYFIDTTTNEILNDANKIKLTFEAGKIWIVNTTQTVTSTLRLSESEVISFKHKINFGKNMSGDLPMIYLKVGDEYILIRSNYTLTPTNAKSELMTAMKNEINQILSSYPGYTVSINGDNIEITGGSGVTQFIILEKQTPDNPWIVSGIIQPSTTYLFKFKHGDEFDTSGIGGTYWDICKLKGKFVGDPNVYTTLTITPGKGGDIKINRGGKSVSIGSVKKANVKLGNNLYETTFELTSSFYVTDFYYDDRDFFGGSDSRWYGWSVWYSGHLLVENLSTFILKDEKWHNINNQDYLATNNVIKNEVIINYISATDSTLYHAAPKVNITIKIANEILYSSDEYLDNYGYSLYSDTQLIDMFYDKYNSIFQNLSMTISKSSGVLTINMPNTYSFIITFQQPEKEINLILDDIASTKFSNAVLEFQEASLPCYIDIDNLKLDRPPLFKTGAVNYKNTATASLPSFANKHIQDIKIIQDRLFILSDEAISISEVGTRDKFFLSSGQTLVDTSFIDARFSVTKGTLKHLIFLNKEFYIFGTQQQFLLHFEGYISPFTMLIQNLTDYQISDTTPETLGNEIFFGNKTTVSQAFERHMLYSFFVQPNTYTNKAENKSWMISDLMPTKVNQIVAINDKVILTYSEPNNNFTSAMVFHRFTNNLEVIQEGWTQWKFPTDLGLWHINSVGDVLTIKAEPTGLQGPSDAQYVLLFYKIPLEQDVANALYDEIYTSYTGEKTLKDIKAKISLPIFTKDIPPYLRARLDFVHLIFDKEFTGYVYYGQDGVISEVLGTINNAIYASIPIRKYARGAEIIIEAASVIEGNPNFENEVNLLANPLNLMGFGAEFRVWNRKYGKY